MAMFVCVINVNANKLAEVRDLAETFLEQEDIDKLDKVDSLTSVLLEKREQLKKYEAEGNLQEAFTLQTDCNRNLDAIIQIFDRLHDEADAAIVELDEIHRVGGDSTKTLILKAKVVVFNEFTSYITEKICGKR